MASLLYCVLACLSCSDEDVPPGVTSTSSSGSGGAGGTGPVATACDVHATTAPARFTDRSEAWGLGAAVVGNRIVSGDLNGDGFPDLLIHAIGSNNREVVGSGTHLVWVLINEPAPGGGRTFVDRTAESGYGTPAEGPGTEYRSAQLAAMADVDNDGDLDLYSGVFTTPSLVQSPPSAADLDRSQLLLNDGQGVFTQAPPSAVQPNKGMPTCGASFTDVNRDAHVDLLLSFHHSNNAPNRPQLLLGAGDGTFVDVSSDSGVGVSATRRIAFGTTACDLDDNGIPELLVNAYARGPNLLLQADPNGHFVDVAVDAGYAYDDLMSYQDNEMFKCWCTANAGAPDCAGVSAPLIACPDPPGSYWNAAGDTEPDRLGGNTFTTVCSDITGDGKLDLYNAEIAHWWAGESSDKSELLVADGEAGALHFARPGQQATGMVWPHPTVDWNEGGIVAAAADLDHDGREDVIAGASDYPDQFGLYFLQQPDGTFREAGEERGFHHPCVSGLTVADFDRDGDLDVIVGSGTARDCAEIWETNEVHFYESDASTAGQWLAVKLVGDGVTANRAGIGARVTVEASLPAEDGTPGPRQLRELGGGYGHMAMQNDTLVFFGLGGCEVVHAVEVTWPDLARTVQRFENVAAGRVVELRQGDPAVYEALAPAP
jgi:hypothetical protein